MSKKMLWLSCASIAVIITLAAVIVGIARTAVQAHGIKMQTEAMCDQGQMKCFALKVNYVNMSTGQTVNMEPNNVSPNAAAPAGFGPADLQAAYNLTQASASAGQGQTIAIVDAQDDPNAESDLATYRSQFGLPACTTANGCFKKVDQNGGTNYPAPNAGWAGEISLDVDMASAICPNCNILLVEANQPTGQDLATAVDTAVQLGANVVSNSYGGPEDAADSADYNHPGVIITASTGDTGFNAGPQQPASFASVVAVGGTSLTQDNSARGWSESAWVDGGGGCSQLVAQPTWQAGLNSGCANRVEADVSAVADPQTGVAVFDSFQENGWVVFGGTSVSSPVVASIYALAGNADQLNAAQSLYQDPADLNDVTTGSNGTCNVAIQCNAGAGWDGPTGVGTPNGLGAF